MSRRRHRYRPLGVEHRGYTIARIEDRETGEAIGVYQRRPGAAWLRYRNDDPVRDRALSATAKRMLG
jgi:hypothetical protein